jgi:hypothetical protein
VNLGVNNTENNPERGNRGVSRRSARSSALVESLSKCGLDRAGLEKLDNDSIEQLGAMISEAGVKAALTIKMFNAVAETSPDQLRRLIGTMKVYAGSLPILNTFLLHLGTWDPFVATRRARIEVLPHKAATESARGASGHVLKGVTFCAYDAEFSGTTTGYISGKQAITKIFEAFNSERVGVAKRSLVTEKRNKALKEALSELKLEDLRLDDLVANPGLASELKRQLLTRNLEVYRELRSAIELCRANLARFAYGDELLLAKSQSLKVASDVGRTFFGWFESHFEENENAPDGIKIAFLSLRDPDIELSPEDERRYIQGLLAYQRIHSFINKSSALGGLLKDLQAYELLKADDPLRLAPRIEQARRLLQERMARSDQELTISEFGALLDDAAMIEFRREMNQRILDRYGAELSGAELSGAELTEALSHFEFVSFESGAWREDALGDAVPMARLKQHLYGAKIGVLRSSDTVSDKRALLANSDFRHIMNGQFLWRLIPEREKLLTAKSVPEFKEMVEGIIVAYRKAKYLEQQLAKYQGERKDGPVSFNRDSVGEALKDWKPVLPIGGQYRPCEVWGEGEDSFNPTINDLREVSARLRSVGASLLRVSAPDTSKLGAKYRDARVSCDSYAAAGLYDPKMFDLWRSLEKKVRALKTARDLGDKLNRAASLLINPIAKLLPWRGAPIGQTTEERVNRLVNQDYFTNEHESQLDGFLGLESQVTNLGGGLNQAELALIGQRIDALNLDRAVIYTVACSPNRAGFQKIALSSRRFIDMVKDARVKDQRAIETVLNLIEGETVSMASLAPDWSKRAKQLFSANGTAVLRSKGFEPIDRAAYETAQGFGLDSIGRVSRELLAIVG